MPTERLESLDALRGLAALTVAVSHSLLVFPGFWAVYQGTEGLGLAERMLGYSPLHLAWGGQEAVLLFFVLSGLVLALPYTRGQAPHYPAFLIKRFFRIYVPYAAVLGASVLAMALLASPPPPGMSGLFNRFWTAPASWPMILDHVFMLGGPSELNPPMWSLVHEMRASILFPLLMLPVMRLGWRPALGLAVALYAGFSWALRFPGPWASWIETGHYLPFFLLGAMLIRHREPLVAWLGKLRGPLVAVLWALALFLVNIRWQLPRSPLDSDLVIGLGATLLIALVLASSRAERGLSHPWLQALGRVSYSFYLVHMVVLLALLHGLPGWPLPALAALALPLALVVACGVHHAVERPAQRWGRAIAQRLEKPARAEQIAA